MERAELKLRAEKDEGKYNICKGAKPDFLGINSSGSFHFIWEDQANYSINSASLVSVQSRSPVLTLS